MSKLHAKTKLKEYLEKKYRKENLEDIRIFSCVEEGGVGLEMFDEIFGDKFSKN